MQKGGKGFTLVEIMIAVVIIGLLAAIAVPSFRKIQLNASSARIMNDLRVFSGNFQQFNLAYGYWPESQVAGVLPDEMEGYISRDSFELRNAIHCYWKWEVFDAVVGIGMTPPATALPILQMVDDRFDDGSLATGRLRIQSGSYAESNDTTGGTTSPGLPDNASDTAHSVIAKVFASKNPEIVEAAQTGSEGAGFIYVVAEY